jgi:hypothetical protein
MNITTSEFSYHSIDLLNSAKSKKVWILLQDVLEWAMAIDSTGYDRLLGGIPKKPNIEGKRSWICWPTEIPEVLHPRSVNFTIENHPYETWEAIDFTVWMESEGLKPDMVPSDAIPLLWKTYKLERWGLSS